jgi:hypothetical protein
MTSRPLQFAAIAFFCGCALVPLCAHAQCTNGSKMVFRQSLNVTGGVLQPPPAIDLTQGCGNNVPVHIVWQAPAGYLFFTGGVAIQSDPQGNFSSGYPGDENTVSAHPPHFAKNHHWLDKNTDGLVHKYSLAIHEEKTGTSISLDPSIINHGSGFGH